MEAENGVDDAKRVVREGYDRISHAYRDDLGARNVGYGQWLEAHLLPMLAAPSKVLDLGCGNGVPATRLLAECHDVIGVDISTVQIERARVLVPNATFVEADMSTVSFAAGSFDAVVSFFALIHVPVDEQPGILARVGTWLKPGGLFLATVGHRAWTGVDDFYGATMYWSHPDASTYCEWLDQSGIDVLTQEFIPEDGRVGHQLILGRRRPEKRRG
jgi:SAM-dependent methyltransferase